MDSLKDWYARNGLEAPVEPLTPQEERAALARERRYAKKERQLDRKSKRNAKRAQAY